jgi:hypothetical protein
MKPHLCPVAAILEGDGHDRSRSRAAILALPGMGEDETLGLDDLAIDAGDPVFLSVRSTQAGPVGTARPKVHLVLRRREPVRSRPAREVLGSGPCLEDELARGIEGSRDQELSIGILSLLTRRGHLSPPLVAAEPNSHPGGRSSRPRTSDSARPIRLPP